MGLLLNTLPDLFDPAKSLGQRMALFDSLRRVESTMKAMEKIIHVVGSVRQKSEVTRFESAVRLAMNTPPTNPPTPGLIGQLAALFGVVTNQFDALRAAAMDVAAEFAGLISFASLLGTLDDDEARNLTSVLLGEEEGSLATIPTQMKTELINRMVEGATVDDDEQAINNILNATRKQSAAEYLQLIIASRFGELDSAIQGAEFDVFMKTLESV
jgi:hypothetical protein